MEALEVREYLLSLPEVEEVMPFSESEAVVYKIGGKWEIRHSYLSVIRKNVSPKDLRTALLRHAEEAGITDAEMII